MFQDKNGQSCEKSLGEMVANNEWLMVVLLMEAKVSAINKW